MLYDTVKYQSDPAFSTLVGMTYDQEGSGVTYVERNRRGGAGSAICSNLALLTSRATPADTPNLVISAGQVGDKVIEEKTLGTIDSNKGKNIFVKVTLNGTDGTYEVDIVNTSPVISATVKSFLLGVVDDQGRIYQYACGPVSVQVCRNWYAGAPPYYGITVSR